MTSPPRLMVSSTFYDLRQIRASLARFIADELGYVPLLSELSSFPIDPDLDTIANCRARVEKDADLFVLMIGGRYGSIDDKTDKSITNLEFLSARQKGIPIYAFIEKGVLALLPTWKDNPNANFTATVDTPRVFDFIEHVRTEERVWSFAFETAQDVVDTLRRQLAFLFSDCLKLRQRFAGVGIAEHLMSLGPKALRIALEQPPGWEYLLYLHSWIDEIDRRSEALLDYRSGLVCGPAEYVPAKEATEWFGTRLHELRGFVDSANLLLNEQTQRAFGEPGQPGDSQRIVWVARALGRLFEELLRWASRIRCARLEQPFDRLGPTIAFFVDNLIQQFEIFPRDSFGKVEESIARAVVGEPTNLKLSMSLTLSGIDAFEAEIAKLVS